MFAIVIVMRKLLLAMLLMVAFIGAVLGDAIWIEPNSVAVSYVKVDVEKPFEGLKIIHISDLHLRGYGWREENIVLLIGSLHPNYIFITGDFIEEAKYLECCLKFLRRVSKICKVYCVLGNWDHWSGVDVNEFKQKFSALNVTLLVNECRKVSVENATMYIVGVDDPYTGNADLSKAMPENASDCSLVILLAHSPQIIGDVSRSGYKVDLILCGHTHGGQVNLPFLGPVFTPLPKEYRKYCSGLYVVNGTFMYVNRGLGTSTLNVRFMCLPEIAVILLT